MPPDFLAIGVVTRDISPEGYSIGGAVTYGALTAMRLGLAPAVHYVGALPLAAAADVISWPVAITIGAALSLFVALCLGVWSPVLRHLEE